MKLECKAEDIKNKILQVERITGKNLTLPILNSILLITSGKSLKLRSTNLSLGIELKSRLKLKKKVLWLFLEVYFMVYFLMFSKMIMFTWRVLMETFYFHLTHAAFNYTARRLLISQ